MTFNHEAVAALPVSGAADKAALRALNTRRAIYVLSGSESATDFVAVDPATGVVPLRISQNNIEFLYDSTDTTTVHDGVTCLVTSDGKRYKSGTIAPPNSVLDKDTVAQPGSPSVGDRYIVPAAATGAAWSGQDGKIAIYTAAGWKFAVSPIGRFIYVEDETAYYHRNASGVWTAGVGSLPLAANSVKITNVLGTNASYVIKVENQTTNAPPGSPVAPVAYVIGPSPTGAWAGNAGKLAVCLVNGAFTIITPVAGDVVYDKARNASFQFNGTAWVAANGVFIDTKRVESVIWSSTVTVIPFDNTIPQITEGDQLITTTYTPKSITNKLRVRFEVNCCSNTAASSAIVALFLNSNSNAIRAATRYFNASDQMATLSFTHEFVPGTTSQITLSVRGGLTGSGRIFFNGNTANQLFGGVNVMSLTIDEIIA